MGWLWSDKESNGLHDDAYSKLDPALKDFLDKESPLKYQDTLPPSQKAPPPAPSSQDAAPNTYRSQLGIDKPGLNQQKQDSAPQHDKPEVPPESLFQDGRYAHLWKNYRSLKEIEQTGTSDQDRLAAVVDAYKERKAQIGRAAIENCVLEQITEKDCFSKGDWHARMTMCREENKAFNRCYTMQSRFLKALGYLSNQRTPEEEELIQMHADKLYQEMMDRERITEEAKKEGREAPVFAPLIRSRDAAPATSGESAWAKVRAQAQAQPAEPFQLSEEQQKSLQERMAGKSQQEKELELELFKMEQKSKTEYAMQIQGVLEEEKQHRAERRERGRETVGDSIKRLWGWDK